MRSFIGGIVALALAGFAALACSTALDAGADDMAPRSPSEAPGFTNADAAAVEAGAATVTSYCPSNKCPAGYTNCPTSRFPCDVNLLSDRQNCGACGVACPAPNSAEHYECVEGHCVLQCNSQPRTLDCDGLPDNGCESSPGEQDSCGGCGITCTDPDKPCVNRAGQGEDYGCGCKDGKTYCQGQCIDTRNEDNHCGACGNGCPSGDIDPSLHMYYGCFDSKCGRAKCERGWANCDGILDNGCETSIASDDNCGTCGNACPAGQSCKKDVSVTNPNTPYGCMCPPGDTFCGGDNWGACYDTSSDPRHCGGCGIQCASVCVNGVCRMDCGTGRADCNGNELDGCEVDIDSDPRNCGGCGIVCNGTAGQACVQGRCVVEPCEDDVDAGRGPQ
ncbi:MAG: hypothetical protein K0S65_1553 [Labilithrix sp.]|nr:hypothetical protein [Labilithrix sp.]